jgi:hypothetical protein
MFPTMINNVNFRQTLVGRSITAGIENDKDKISRTVYSILLIPAPPSGNLIALAHHSALLAFPHS